MNEEHHANLKMYVNDVIALERQIAGAVRTQAEDDSTLKHPGFRNVLLEIAGHSEDRITLLKELSDAEGGSLGATVKEGITTVTGVLAGLYGKIRKHEVSRMVRDDIIAMDVAAISYSMLLTLGLAIGHRRCVELATLGLNACPSTVVRLTNLMPAIVIAELAEDAPLADPSAAEAAVIRIREAWNSKS